MKFLEFALSATWNVYIIYHVSVVHANLVNPCSILYESCIRICHTLMQCYVLSSVKINPSTQHTAMVHTMHTGTSTQNVYFRLVECSELVRKLISSHIIGLASCDATYIEVVWCAFISVYAMCSSSHPPKCFLTDAQMIRKRRMRQDCFCY